MTVAYTRAVSPRLAECQLTHMQREPLNPARAAKQHEAYEATLRSAGFQIERLPPLDDAPDGVFVEDTAVLLGEHAVITRPGSPVRARETDSTGIALSGRFVIHQLPGGVLDGGDVLRIGRTLYVGLSARTNRAGAQALQYLAAPLGFTTVPVRVRGCLHLKTGATFAGHGRDGALVLLVNQAWVDPADFAQVEPLSVPDEEPFAANTLRIGPDLLMAAGAPRTRDLLHARGFKVVEIDISELQKAEAGLTCMSLISSERM